MAQRADYECTTIASNCEVLQVNLTLCRCLPKTSQVSTHMLRERGPGNMLGPTWWQPLALEAAGLEAVLPATQEGSPQHPSDIVQREHRPQDHLLRHCSQFWTPTHNTE
eukprot:CAMPEP_0171058048 /NCGR_PEP_ID=MMETSP0766_2-20121228/2230_1 /TAXON_ID=439317 /ORGANISM="Gambierdiscus australes, Strain CAWD 149" /LENGTH=108 /DNA_ID=CAMNT_0011513263 /DNA_START=354 /DNA_END=677 /DNA_ORIENTATION=-